MRVTTVDQASTVLIKVAIPAVNVLSSCYMPFLERKGLFIPSVRELVLGDRVFLVLRLGPAQIFAAGAAHVCWTTPAQSSDGRVSGFGLHFDDVNSDLAQSIDACLNQNKQHDRTGTHTL